MELIENLKSDGWNLSESGWKRVTDDGNLTDKTAVEEKALDIDLRELGGCAFPAEVTKGKDSLSGPFVVQVQKIRNISAPKANEESKAAPRLLKLTLTDGSQVCLALEMSTVSDISLNTPPGTKLRLKGKMTISHSVLQLHTSNVKVLGGKVATMEEKWQLNRRLAKHTRRFGVEGGPPPWIPFGEKIAPTNLSDKNFKSLDDGNKDNKDEEFEAQRRDAIAEAGKGSVRKVFGGGTKPLLDKNVQAIMEQGFTVEQAESALKQARNNPKKALKILQRPLGGRNSDNKDKTELKDGERRQNRRKGDEDPTPKPSGKVCLFQFLEDKLPANQPTSNNGAGLVEKEKEKELEWDVSKCAVERPRNSGSQFREKRESGRDGGGSGSVYRGLENSGSSRGPADRRNRDDRRTNPPQASRKAPRFQNQNKQSTDYNSMPQFGQYNKNDNSFMTTENNDFLLRKNENYNRPSNKFDSYGYSNANGDYRNASSSYYKRPGMPEIPEFPYKDPSYIPSLMATTLDYFPNTKPQKSTEKRRWRVGDKCLAKYWEDNLYYNAEITGVSNTTCVVRFLGYNNYEEVLHDHCVHTEDANKNAFINSQDPEGTPSYSSNPGRNNFSGVGVCEVRRGGQSRGYKGDNQGGRKGNPRYTQPVYVPPASRK